MTAQSPNPARIMMVAGEASGDLHGGALAEALLKEDPSLQIVGFGGTAMRRAGVEVIFDIAQLGVVGIFEVFLHLKSVWEAYRMGVKTLESGVDLLVLIDYPDFNLRLAKAAKQRGVPVVYYISPQVWAWRAGRVKTIGERIDQMLVILPFEERIYTEAGIPCEFVGHPLLDEAASAQLKYPSKSAYLEGCGLLPEGTTIGLLPGSRHREVLSHLPTMLEAMALLAKEIPGLQLLVPVAPSLSKEWVLDLTRRVDLPLRCVEGEFQEVLRASDAVVVASGTATLQTALAQAPMVIVYKLSPLTYWLARRLIRLKSIGLVNIVAGRPIVPELIQAEASPERIRQEVGRLLKDGVARERMKGDLKEVAERLGAAGASSRAAAVILERLKRGRVMRERKSPRGTG
ncbi:MAG: lipid-A-disaccharide synthase [Nitrospirae bacterium]|nr:lipid-A-disaccharide synthase [Candidatus Manganitrophaceae bacterium]